MHPSPAFTTVPARRKFAPPEPSPAPPQAKAPTKKVDWPQPVREYVQRSFAPDAAIPGIEREEIERVLKKVITEAAEKDALVSTNWEAMPLPQQIIQTERARMAMPVAVVTEPWQRDATPNRHVAFAGHSHGDSSRKRKSADTVMTDADDDSTPPWRKANSRNVFEDRITYANQGQADRVEKRQKRKPDDLAKGTSKYQENLEKRKQRFENGKPGNRSPQSLHHSQDGSPLDANEGPIIGTCQDLEKRYFRLTSAPKPETVRPLHILEQTLDLLKKKWKKESNYTYICDQFKSLRQDLTVQHIKNEFTVNAYEIHARIALEKGDLGEYNQCQTQLRALYLQKLGGHPAEFLAYRILYFIYTCNRTDMNDILADLTPTDKQQPAVKHALDVRSALALGNYHRFFRLYLETPNMGAYLMDMFIARERVAALANICKAYKPDVKIRFLTEELGFESDQDCVQFLCDHGAQGLLEDKTDSVVFQTGKAGLLFENAKNAAFRKVDIKGQI
ncbi:hypothetical protein H2199_008185 [Coniosporium tulheliwenetii]|uniref:Uncharacterized protein n=1 Tax=Coniosporium tulheliwenetii TaxID=3383036 RepID=A0ACC2YKP5_9PEZI|nr:hypothetical protein H2199_008185 [Cladosporium sp. JES 115]